MQSNFKIEKFLILNFLFLSVIITANAESVSTTTERLLVIASSTPIIDSTTTIEVSIPLKNTDFLMFYGITNDETTDASILDLRKDFANKFATMKSEYFDKINNTLKDKILFMPDLDLEEKIDSSTSSTSSKPHVSNNIAKKPIKIIRPVKFATEIKILSNLNIKDSFSTSSEINLDPIMHFLNAAEFSPKNLDGSFHFENKGWFSKLKSWFNK